MPLVSIIVPVYNIEAYLPRCIDSILSQTHRNLDIILVDDGSNDNSGSICDTLAECDKRIRVFHQENKGASVARNSGIVLAKGEFICFVDGDDQIHSKMIELLLEPILSNSRIDISVCNLITYSEVYDPTASIQPAPSKIVSSEIAFQELLYQRIINGPVAKLFHRNILKTIRFPADIKVGEDLLMNIAAFQIASHVALRSEKLYGYYMRPGSAMHSSTLEDRVHLIESLEAARVNNTFTTEVETAFRSRIFSESVYALLVLPDYSHENIRNIRQMVYAVFQHHRKTVLFNTSTLRFFRILAAASFVSMQLPRLIFLWRSRLGALLKRTAKLRS